MRNYIKRMDYDEQFEIVTTIQVNPRIITEEAENYHTLSMLIRQKSSGYVLETIYDNVEIPVDETERFIRKKEQLVKDYMDQTKDPDGTDFEKEIKTLGFSKFV